MASETFYTAIDLGTTKVCTIIAKIGPEGELKVLGTGIVPSQGMNKGRVESISETKEAVKASLEEAQRYLGRSVSWAYLGVTGDHITSLNTTGFLKGSGENEAISSEDLQRLIDSSYPQVSNGKEVLHVIPTGYLVDGLTGVRNPVGLHADRVQVESHVVMGEAAVLKNLGQDGGGLRCTCKKRGPSAPGSGRSHLDPGRKGAWNGARGYRGRDHRRNDIPRRQPLVHLHNPGRGQPAHQRPVSRFGGYQTTWPRRSRSGGDTPHPRPFLGTRNCEFPASRASHNAQSARGRCASLFMIG